MYSLTLWQPWARLVAAGVKLVENRPWAPPKVVTGQRVALHAGMGFDADAEKFIRDHGVSELPGVDVRGAVIATFCVFGSVNHAMGASALDAIWSGAFDDRWRDQKRWWFGVHGWLLCDVRKLAMPVPCRGFQRLWRLKPDALAAVLDQGG